MPPPPGRGNPAERRRRDLVRAALASLRSSPASSRRAAAAAVGSAWLVLPRVAVWLAIGGLVVLFGMVTDGIRVGVVALPAMVVGLTWRQLSSPVRAAVVLGLLWLSLAQLGVALGLGLDALLVAWWWLPARVGSASAAGETPAEPEAAGPGPESVDDRAFGLYVSASLRRFAEERRLSQDEVAMLASIRFTGEAPRTAARWQHIYNAIRLSRWLDREDVG
jgi:hypothetical protein